MPSWASFSFFFVNGTPPTLELRVHTLYKSEKQLRKQSWHRPRQSIHQYQCTVRTPLVLTELVPTQPRSSFLTRQFTRTKVAAIWASRVPRTTKRHDAAQAGSCPLKNIQERERGSYPTSRRPQITIPNRIFTADLSAPAYSLHDAHQPQHRKRVK